MSLFIRGTTVVQNTANKGPLFKEPKWVAAAGGGQSGAVVGVTRGGL